MLGVGNFSQNLARILIDQSGNTPYTFYLTIEFLSTGYPVVPTLIFYKTRD